MVFEATREEATLDSIAVTIELANAYVLAERLDFLRLIFLLPLRN